MELILDGETGAEATVTLPITATGVFLAELLDGEDVLSELSLSVLPPVESRSARRRRLSAAISDSTSST